MRIGVDVSTWFNGRGFGRFTRELVSAMIQAESAHDWVLFSDRTDMERISSPNVSYVVVQQSIPVTQAAVADGSRRVSDMLSFTRAVKKEALDVLFYPAVYSWFPSPVGLPVVLTIHDAIAEHFPALVFPTRFNRFLWWLKLRLANAQATRILTVSNAAKQEIVEHLHFGAEKIDVTTEGPNSIFRPIADDGERLVRSNAVRLRHEMPADAAYFVYVGGFAPHKNLLGLMDAFARVKERHSANNVHLLLVGDYSGHGFHSNYLELRERIDGSSVLSGAVHFTGFISDSELVDIYATALAMVFPSLSEGFGLPAIESMATGTPVLASNCASLPEVVGDAGLLFDPRNIDSMVATMTTFIDDEPLRHELREKALERVQNFTWEIAAERALASIERSVAN